jgi:hypothetical protein
MDSEVGRNNLATRTELLAYSIGASIALAGCTSGPGSQADSTLKTEASSVAPSSALPLDLTLRLLRQPGQLGGARGSVGPQEVRLVARSSPNNVSGNIGSTRINVANRPSGEVPYGTFSGTIGTQDVNMILNFERGGAETGQQYTVTSSLDGTIGNRSFRGNNAYHFNATGSSEPVLILACSGDFAGVQYSLTATITFRYHGSQ